MVESQYTKQAWEAFQIAKKAAAQFKHPYVGTEHLLWGLKKVYTGVAGQVLAQNQLDEEQMKKAMDVLISTPEQGMPGRKAVELSPRLEYILEESRNEAANFHSEKVGTEHMLIAMLKDGDCIAAKMLSTLNINVNKVFQDLLIAMGIDPREYAESQKDGEGQGGIVEQNGFDTGGKRRKTGPGDWPSGGNRTGHANPQ